MKITFVLEAAQNDNQLKTILSADKIEELMNKVSDKEEQVDTLVNLDRTLNYTKIKEFLKINSPPPALNRKPIEPPTPQNPLSPNSPLVSAPSQENSQKSEENIQEINNSASLAKAQTRAQTEISSLLERYGVKVEQLSASLWENETSWENYLTSKCTKVDKASQLVRKMKIAIMQQSHQNQQIKQQLTVPQLRNKINQAVEELLKKYPQIKTKQISDLKDWKIHLGRKNSNAEFIAYERQLREAIVLAGRQTSSLTTNPPKSTWKTKLLIGGTIIFVTIGIGCLVATLWNKRIRRRSKKNK